MSRRKSEKHADKAAVVAALSERIGERLQSLFESQKTAQEGSVHEETRQEDPKDTRAIEAGYLARGLAERVEAMRDARSALATLRLRSFGPDDEAGMTALVAVSDDDERQSIYFLVPVGGGERIELDGLSIQSLTPKSPLGRALIEQCAGDEIEVYLPGSAKDSPTFLTIDWIE
jgi:transcription elongation GreA/GreB family factor